MLVYTLKHPCFLEGLTAKLISYLLSVFSIWTSTTTDTDSTFSNEISENTYFCGNVSFCSL